ncbi:MAG: sigma-54-dependent transcriptional regulator [Phycisphaerae bacterium]
MARIAVVDDQEILRDSLTETLSREKHDVTSYDDSEYALVQCQRERFDLVLVDLRMPKKDGLTFIKEFRAAGCEQPVIMMTAFASVDTAVEAMKLGAVDYIQKPFDAEAVVVLIERSLETARLRTENELLRASVEDSRERRMLVGSGITMTTLRAQLDRIADSHATVMIAGESGTGKELVAQYIHRLSPRAAKPMLCLNCAALSANLLESELFGHERGAFTGADRLRKGRFELADGGTLLLDEISEMALPLQAKLLRVLQEGEFERVGSSTTRRADVRVIATTNRDLQGWVKRKRFRSDLYFRLNVLPVAVPPLRERIEDIDELANFFLQKSPAAQRDGLTFSLPALDVLRQYHWPGNVRELENLCERAATLCLEPSIPASLITPWVTPAEANVEQLGPLREGRMLEDMERHLIERTLARHNGHRAKSAKALGMGVRTLTMKLKQWREQQAAEERVRSPQPELNGVGVMSDVGHPGVMSSRMAGV